MQCIFPRKQLSGMKFLSKNCSGEQEKNSVFTLLHGTLERFIEKMHCELHWQWLFQFQYSSYLHQLAKKNVLQLEPGSIVFLARKNQLKKRRISKRAVYWCGKERKAQIYLSADGMKFEFLTCLQLCLVSDKRCIMLQKEIATTSSGYSCFSCINILYCYHLDVAMLQRQVKCLEKHSLPATLWIYQTQMVV